MRGPSLQTTTAVSLLLHLALLALSVVLINYTKNIVLPSPYMVTLVSSSSPRSSGGHGLSPEEAQPAAEETANPESDNSKMIEKTRKSEEERLKKIMAVLSAKNRVKRSIELGKKMAEISVRGSVAKSGARSSEKAGPAGGPKGSAGDLYIAKITEEIWQQWGYPDYMKKDLEAIVSVVIGKDGAITVQGVEKSSGDRFFDRSALEAVRKASPLSPPPYEMEIGIRFYP